MAEIIRLIHNEVFRSRVRDNMNAIIDSVLVRHLKGEMTKREIDIMINKAVEQLQCAYPSLAASVATTRVSEIVLREFRYQQLE